MDRLDDHVLLRLFSYVLSVRDLAGCSMVCRRWRRLLETDSHPWEQAVRAEVPRDFITDKLVKHMKPKVMYLAYQCAWSEKDHSENISINDNKLTLHRRPVAQSTDAIRGKRGFSSGQHYWIIIWHGPSFGSNAVVGVATKKSSLHGEGYFSLLGTDKESWGWDLSKKVLRHHGNNLGSYPRVDGVEVKLQQKIGVHLDMTKRTLAFEINGKYLGVAFKDLPSVPLYPAISSVYGNSEISLLYLGLPLVG